MKPREPDYNKWGRERGGRPVVSDDFVAAMRSVNPYFPDASASLLALPNESQISLSGNAVARFGDSDLDQSVIFCIFGLAIKKIPF